MLGQRDHCTDLPPFLFVAERSVAVSACCQILSSGDPVNAGDVEKVEADERNNNSTGLLAKGGATAKIQVESAHVHNNLHTTLRVHKTGLAGPKSTFCTES